MNDPSGAGPPGPGRVVILGAGPAGLSVARALVEAGHSDLVVLERERRVGGKCASLELGGQAYDLGANFTTPRYLRTRALAEEVGLLPEPLRPRRIVPVTEAEPPKVGWALGHLLALAVAWTLRRRAGTGVDADGFLEVTAGARRPLRTWLSRGGTGSLQRVFDTLFVAYGYGKVADLPAAYALKFFDDIHLRTALEVIRGAEVLTTTEFPEGFAALWSRTVDHWSIPVELGAEIRAVERGPDGVRVRWTRDGHDHETRGDTLVLALPLEGALGFLDATPEERRLFGQIRTFDYRVVAATVAGLDPVSTYLHPWSQVVTPGRPTAFYKPTKLGPEVGDVRLFYAYGDEDLDDEALVANLAAALAHPTFSARLVEVHAIRRWRMFPHVSCEVMQAGFYEDLEALQGRRGTWYAGEILSFSLVELVIRYSERLAARLLAGEPG